MSSDKILNIKDASSFDSTINDSSTPVLVDFWAPWCGPCKTIAPILEELASEMADQVQICKIDVDDNQELATRYGIRAIPTLLLFKDGQLVDQVVGMASKDDLKVKIKAQL